MAERTLREIGSDPSILLVDDDEPFLKRLGRAMEKRGFTVEMAGSVAAGKAIATVRPPKYAVVDLRLEDGNGLEVVEVIRSKRPESRIVILTGYGAITTAVAAVKIGAIDYLAKPADANDVTSALLAHDDDRPPAPQNPIEEQKDSFPKFPLANLPNLMPNLPFGPVPVDNGKQAQQPSWRSPIISYPQPLPNLRIMDLLLPKKNQKLLNPYPTFNYQEVLRFSPIDMWNLVQQMNQMNPYHNQHETYK